MQCKIAYIALKSWSKRFPSILYNPIYIYIYIYRYIDIKAGKSVDQEQQIDNCIALDISPPGFCKDSPS